VADFLSDKGHNADIPHIELHDGVVANIPISDSQGHKFESRPILSCPHFSLSAMSPTGLKTKQLSTSHSCCKACEAGTSMEMSVLLFFICIYKVGEENSPS